MSFIVEADALHDRYIISSQDPKQPLDWHFLIGGHQMKWTVAFQLLRKQTSCFEIGSELLCTAHTGISEADDTICGLEPYQALPHLRCMSSGFERMVMVLSTKAVKGSLGAAVTILPPLCAIQRSELTTGCHLDFWGATGVRKCPSGALSPGFCNSPGPDASDPSSPPRRNRFPSREASGNSTLYQNL
jgi:hypothetical protein